MKDDVLSPLFAGIERNFAETDSEITMSLLGRNNQYTALKAKLSDLERRFPFIEQVLDGEGAVNLTAEQHASLVDFIRTTDETENKERLNLYLAGHRDCLAYLEKIGLL